MSKSKKSWPTLTSDVEAEDFISNSNLAEYDWSVAEPVSYEFENKDEKVTLRISKNQLQAIKDGAFKRGIKYQRFMREIMEKGLQASKI